MKRLWVHYTLFSLIVGLLLGILYFGGIRNALAQGIERVRFENFDSLSVGSHPFTLSSFFSNSSYSDFVVSDDQAESLPNSLKVEGGSAAPQRLYRHFDDFLDEYTISFDYYMNVVTEGDSFCFTNNTYKFGLGNTRFSGVDGVTVPPLVFCSNGVISTKIQDGNSNVDTVLDLEKAKLGWNSVIVSYKRMNMDLVERTVVLNGQATKHIVILSNPQQAGFNSLNIFSGTRAQSLTYFDDMLFESSYFEANFPDIPYTPDSTGAIGTSMKIVTPYYGEYISSVNQATFELNVEYKATVEQWYTNVANDVLLPFIQKRKYYIVPFAEDWRTKEKVYFSDTRYDVINKEKKIRWQIPTYTEDRSIYIGVDLYSEVCLPIIGCYNKKIEDTAKVFVHFNENVYKEETGFNDPIAGGVEEILTDCETWDIGCQIQRGFLALFKPSGGLNNDWMIIKSQAESKFPFSYMTEINAMIASVDFDDTRREELEFAIPKSALNSSSADISFSEDMTMFTTENVVGNDGLIKQTTFDFLRRLLGFIVYAMFVWYVFGRIKNFRLKNV